MTIQDLSTYTEVDSSNRLSRTSTTETVTSLGTAETAYSYKDFGAGYFTGSYYAEGTLGVGTLGTPATIFFGFGTALGTWGGDNDCAGILLQNSTGYTPYADLKTGGVETDGIGTNLTASTTYYYRIGVLSALGQYGGLMMWVYSDSGMTTLVSSAINLKTTSASYRYFYPARSLGSGSGTINSLTNANITLFAPAAGLTLTSFTEVDPNTHLTQYADCSDITTLNTNETAYLYKDYTAGYISGDYTFRATVNVTGFSSGTGQMLNLLSCVNTLGHANLTNDLQGVALIWGSSSTFTLKAREVTGGTEYLSSASSTLTTNIPVFVQINRDTAVGTYGTLYVKVFGDPAYTIQIGSTVSLTLHDNGTPDKAAFRYFNAVQSYNTGSNNSTTLTVGTVTANISTIPPTTGTITFTQADNTVAASAARAYAASVSIAQANNTVAVAAAKDAPIFVPQWTQADNTVAVAVTYKTGMSVSVPQASNIVSAVAGLITVVEQFSVRVRHKTTGAALTGLTTVTLTACQPSTGYRLDFNDGTFKASPTTPTKILNEVSAANQPGLYRCDVTTTLFAGWVEFEVTYNDGTYTYSYPGEAYYTAGSRSNGVWSVAQQGQMNLIQAYAANPAPAIRSDLATELARILELAQLHGLDASHPLSVTPTSRSAGAISQTISTVGDAVTVTRS